MLPAANIKARACMRALVELWMKHQCYLMKTNVIRAAAKAASD
jgi:hypothetical protein